MAFIGGEVDVVSHRLNPKTTMSFRMVRCCKVPHDTGADHDGPSGAVALFFCEPQTLAIVFASLHTILALHPAVQRHRCGGGGGCGDGGGVGRDGGGGGGGSCDGGGVGNGGDAAATVATVVAVVLVLVLVLVVVEGAQLVTHATRKYLSSSARRTYSTMIKG